MTALLLIIGTCFEFGLSYEWELCYKTVTKMVCRVVKHLHGFSRNNCAGMAQLRVAPSVGNRLQLIYQALTVCKYKLVYHFICLST